MTRTNLIFISFLVLLSFRCFSEILPSEGSRLNYTTVYFEENLVKEAVEYKLVVYSDSLLSKPLVEMKNKLPAFWAVDLNWATTYYWRVEGFMNDGKKLYSGSLHKFSIMKIVYQNFDEIRIDVKTNKEPDNAGGLISIDYTKSIINRKGRQVWAIPPIDSVPIGKMYIRDMRITKDNTITFLTFQVPYEIDFNGRIVWQAPYPLVLNSDTIVYHHDFKKTNRGTYMVLGDKGVYRRVIGQYTDKELKNSPEIKAINGELFKRTLISILLEFDKEGKLIWYWDANDYVKDIDLNFKKVEGSTPNFATHANAFGENKQGTKVYVGFRDLSRIVKIDKKTKKVELSYGESYPSGEATVPVKFNNQHDANVSDHNSIYVFNNNGFKSVTGISSILELQDNIKPRDSAIIWKFDLNFDNLTRGKSVNGGNIVELPNKNLLFCAGSLHRMFEITKNKEIVWDALLYSRGIKDTLWEPFPQYRCNWIKQLNWYHFIAALDSKPAKSGKSYSGKINISNTGNSDDTYELKIFSHKEVLLQTIITKQVKSNENILVSFKLKTRDNLKNLKIIVKSKNSDENEILTF